MHLNDIFENEENQSFFRLINREAKQFYEECGSIPLLKSLPSSYSDFQRVKVRKRKKLEKFSLVFNNAFINEVYDIRQRSIFANGEKSFKIQEDNHEPFYIFPIDGFKFLYSKEVENSTKEYKKVFDSILENLGEEEGKKVFIDLLKFTYKTDNLIEGIESGAEIIIYDIPYYYVIRKSIIENYNELIDKIYGEK